MKHGKIILLLLLPGCHVWNTKKIEQATVPLQKKAYAQFEYTPSSIKKPAGYVYDMQEIYLTRQTAVERALEYNKNLLVEFHELGVSQANLIQAGLYTNPSIISFVRLPEESKEHTQYEIDLTFLLSDLWQVPIKKTVAQDTLEITTKKIIGIIAQTIVDTKVAYDEYLYAKKLIEINSQIYQMVQKIKPTVDDPFVQYKFSKESLAEEMTVLDSTTLLHNAEVKLKVLLGLPFTTTIKCDEHLDYTSPAFVPFETIVQTALCYNPDYALNQVKINQADHTIALEKSLIFNNVTAGVTYEQDFDGTRGPGVIVGMNLPFFNWNDGAIARARIVYEQAQDKQRALKISIEEELRYTYANLHNIFKKIIALKQFLSNANHLMTTSDEKLADQNLLIHRTEKELYSLFKEARALSYNLEKIIGCPLHHIVMQTN